MAPGNLYLGRLGPSDGEAYRAIAPPWLPAWLDEVGDDSHIGVGGSLLWDPFPGPVGVALASHSPGGGTGELRWLFVHPRYRRQGIGSALLDCLGKVVRERGGVRLGFSFTPASEGVDALEPLLLARGWTVSRSEFLRGWGDPSILAAPWIRKARLPADLELVGWPAITAEERRALQSEFTDRGGPERRIDGLPDPFLEEACVEPRASLWLRQRGHIAGWVVVHRVDDETIRIHLLYARPTLRRTGRAISALTQAIRSACAIGYRRALFDVRPGNDAMVRFIRRRLVPYGVTTEDLGWAERALGSSQEGHSLDGSRPPDLVPPSAGSVS